MPCHSNISANHENSSTRKEKDEDSNNRGLMPVLNIRISSENEVEMKSISDSVENIRDPGILPGESIS